MTNEELQEAYEREEASARIRLANIEWLTTEPATSIEDMEWLISRLAGNEK